MHALDHGSSSRARAWPRGATLALAVVLASAIPACADSMVVSSDAGPRLDATMTTTSVAMLACAPIPASAASARLRTPAPVPLVTSPRGPSGLPAAAARACPITRPPGDCDRCPERACRQVRVPRGPDEMPAWAMFCDAGDVLEEALIACLCSGGDALRCDHSARETAVALFLIDHVFGGDVPPIGTRYRDGYGLRAVVDRELHEWLAAIAGPPPVVRCSAPDRDGAARAYEERAQRVRTTGSCSASE